MSGSRKGTRAERDLATLFDENGFAVIRAPASGAATERELPDVLVGNGEVVFAIESKASGGDPIYIDRTEVQDLITFADKFGATARIVVRFDQERGDPTYGTDMDPFYMMAPELLHQTPKGNYRVRKDEAMDLGVLVHHFFDG